MRRLAGLAVVLVLMLPFAPSARAEQPLPDGNAAELPESWAEAVEEAPLTADEFRQMTLPDLIEKGFQLLGENLSAPLRLAAKLCGLLLLAAAARSMCAQRTSPQTAELVDTVITLAAFTLCAPSMLGIMELLQQAIETGRNYVVTFVPVFASVLVSCGQVGGAALYSGFFFGASMMVADVLCGVCLPLTRILMALNATACVGSTLDLSGVTASVGKWMKWVLTLCATVFGTLVSLQGVLAQSADTLALKTGKFIIGSSIPVVGRAVSDAMGSVLAGLKLVKGTVGFAVIAVIAAAFIPIILQCCAYHVTLSLGGLIASATGSDKSARLFSGLADCVSIYISMVFFFSLIVVASTLVMILFGNGG